MFLQFVILLYQAKHQIKYLKISVISADNYARYVFVELDSSEYYYSALACRIKY